MVAQHGANGLDIFSLESTDPAGSHDDESNDVWQLSDSWKYGESGLADRHGRAVHVDPEVFRRIEADLEELANVSVGDPRTITDPEFRAKAVAECGELLSELLGRRGIMLSTGDDAIGPDLDVSPEVEEDPRC